MPPGEISDAQLAGKSPEATRQQAVVLPAATVAGDGALQRWPLKKTANRGDFY